MQVAAELVSGEAEVVSEETELLASEAIGALGDGLGNGAVDFLDARDQDVFGGEVVV